jgi:hypothetical protein
LVPLKAANQAVANAISVSGVIPAGINVEFYFDPFGARVANQRRGSDFAHGQLVNDVF